MDLCTEKIESLPIWIQLPDLGLKYWGPSSFSKICSTLGIPLKTDKFTKDRAMIRFAKVMVDMKLEGPFPEYIEFFNEQEVLLRQKVKYEWLPTKCLHCEMFGLLETKVKEKNVKKIAAKVFPGWGWMHNFHLEPKGRIWQRQELWDELSTYEPSDEPWCVIGDFNAILYKEDRMGGDEVRMAELLDLKSFVDTCELQEMRSIGPYYF
ncbi:hypothetical protein Cgig2_002085 [Carnegiea gigantea]|uniref:DUF4283 domain-containing protein n=1 Tax=Carnegiea gigantea TaxID=171969 RepID=A0A9Q1JUQ1_9CARY|nr:hypothetical protein Cgig2_002085 [Carnegiea gigantea]